MTDVRTIGVLLAAALLLAACGSEDRPVLADGSAVSDDGSAITVEGAESAILDEGDDGPAEPAGDAAEAITVAIDVPPDAELAGTAIIALEDVSLADAGSIQIAAVEVPAGNLAAIDNEVEIILPLPLDGTIDVAATVHIDTDESGGFSQGDWISPDLVLVTPETTTVAVTIVPI